MGFDSVEIAERLARDLGYRADLEAAEDELNNIFTQLELIAPEGVRKAAFNVGAEFTRTTYFTVRSWNQRRALQCLDGVIDRHFELGRLCARILEPISLRAPRLTRLPSVS